MVKTLKTLYTVFLLLLFQSHLYGQEIQYRVLFEYNKSDIPDSALIEIIKIIHKQEIERVLIEAHCDSVGSSNYNINLSNRRAGEVKKLLLQNGINPKNIRSCLGFGKEKPLNKNATELERQLNRRAILTFYPAAPSKKNIPVFPKDSALAKPKDPPKIYNEEVKEGNSLIFENLLFFPGRHLLMEESYPVLAEILELFENYPGLEVEIQGHICCSTYQDDGYDWDTGLNNLSVSRAEAIYNFLIKNGVNKARLQYKGYGGKEKINEDESTEELRRVNRRVEFKILKL